MSRSGPWWQEGIWVYSWSQNKTKKTYTSKQKYPTLLLDQMQSRLENTEFWTLRLSLEVHFLLLVFIVLAKAKYGDANSENNTKPVICISLFSLLVFFFFFSFSLVCVCGCGSMMRMSRDAKWLLSQKSHLPLQVLECILGLLVIWRT